MYVGGASHKKDAAGDKFEMISGITGLLGCADGAFVLQKEKRTDSAAILDVVGRDQPDQRIHLVRDEERLIWCFDHADRELWDRTAGFNVSGNRKTAHP